MNRQLLILLASAGLVVGMAQVAAAQNGDADPANWCAMPLEEGAEFSLAKVTAVKDGKVHFANSNEGCPDASNAKCQEKAYLVPGDEVVVVKKYENWLCGMYQPKNGRGTIGWLPAGRLKALNTETNPPLASWVGNWNGENESIKIRRGSKAGQLSVSGDAQWVGQAPGAVNVGGVSAAAAPRGNKLDLKEGDEDETCKVSLRLVGDYLVAVDNNKCGGLNVSFDGVLRRVR
jgi:hypothetical protein